MKKVLLLFFLIPSFVYADEPKYRYWSYGCDTYIYEFDIEHRNYKIYARIDVEIALLGKYTSYLLTEGKLELVEQSIYRLSSEDIDGDAELNFSDPEMVTMQSQKYGYVGLTPCDRDSAHQLIEDAEEYFENCPKDTIGKCP